MSEPKEPVSREIRPEDKDILKVLTAYFDEHGIPIAQVLGGGTPDYLADHKLVVRERVDARQNIFFDLRDAKGLAEARFYPAPERTESRESPHYAVQKTDRFVVFVDDIGLVEQHSVIVIDDAGEVSFAGKHYIGPVVSTDGKNDSKWASLSLDIPEEQALGLIDYMMQNGQPIAWDRLRMFDENIADSRDRYSAVGVFERSPDNSEQPKIMQVAPGVWAVGQFSLDSLIKSVE